MHERSQVELRDIIKERRKQYQHLFRSRCHEIIFVPIIKNIHLIAKSLLLHPFFCTIGFNRFFAIQKSAATE
jgi:hypothetical protein